MGFKQSIRDGMRIAVIMRGNSISGGGGAERRFIFLFNQLCNYKKNNVYLILNKKLYNSIAERGYIDKHQNVLIVPDYPIFSTFFFNIMLLYFLVLKRFDTLHLVLIQKSLIPFYIFCVFFKKNKFRVVGTVASYIFAYGLHTGYLNRFLYRLYIGACDHIDSLYPGIVFPKKSYTVTPCSFIDYNLFLPSSKDNIVVYSGRFVQEKNPHMFLVAVNNLIKSSENSRVADWRFYLCGDGPLYNDLNNYIKFNKLERFVTIGKFDMSKVFPHSRIFVSIQEYENYPSQALLEAIATENSIIATDVGSTRLMIDDQTTLLIPVNQEALQDALAKLIFKGGFSTAALQNASKKIRTTHSVQIFEAYLYQIWTSTA